MKKQETEQNQPEKPPKRWGLWFLMIPAAALSYATAFVIAYCFGGNPTVHSGLFFVLLYIAAHYINKRVNR